MNKKIRYALHFATNNVIHVSAAERGLRCGCRCLECGTNLEAVKGTQRENYFRHIGGNACSGETAIHRYAKQVIADNSSIHIPGGKIIYNNARVEMRLDTKRPDVTVSSNGEDVYFEIRVKNALNEEKKRFYHDGRHKCFEIDLSDRNLWVLPPEELKRVILDEIDNKTLIEWYHWEGENRPAAYEEKSSFYFWKVIAFIGTILLIIFAVIFFKRRKKRVIRYY